MVDVLTSGTLPMVLRERSQVIVFDMDDTEDRRSAGIFPEPVIKQVDESRGIKKGTAFC